MADETDPLTQAMIDAGLYPQQLRQIQQQYGMGQQFMEPQQATGRNVGQTYVASSPLEHLSNAIRQVIGAKMAGGALQKERDLTAQVGSGRQAVMGALNRASGQQSPGTPEMLARPADPQEMQRLMMMAAGSGDPAMENMAKMAMQGQHYQNELQRLQNTERYQQGMLGLRSTEQGATSDAYGNPIMYQKHALPGAVGASGGAGGQKMAGMGMSSNALDQAAELYARTGTLPPLRGKAGAGLAVKIQNRAAELHADNDLAGNKAGYKADTASLTGLQKQSDAMNSFEGTALKNLDQFLQAAHSVVDTGSPLFNAPARKFQQAFQGDPKMTAFNVSRQVAVQEISKVLGGSLGNAAVSDSARHEVGGLISPDASLAQIEKAAQILKADMANRRASMAEQIAAVRGRAGSKGGGGGAPPAVPAEVANPVPPAAHPQANTALEWAKAHPADPRSAKILQTLGVSP